MICENCGKEHDGSYGSGRFCCKSCAISFTNKNRNRTKEQQDIINKKISVVKNLMPQKFVMGGIFIVKIVYEK